MVVLDSDILVGILRGDKEAVKFLEALEQDGERLNTTVVNAFELFEGAFLHSKKEDIIKKVETLLISLGCLNFTQPASRIAAEISADLRKRGAIIDMEDICIAGIANLNDEAVVTKNAKHFERIKELKIKKW